MSETTPNVLEMLDRLEAPPSGGVLYAILRRNAGWALQFYEGPEREDDSVPDNWRDHLRVRAYHETLEDAVRAEYAARVGGGDAGKGEG